MTAAAVRGAAWLSGLDEVIAGLEQQWSMTVGTALTGGSASFVVRARLADGQDAVLKIELAVLCALLAEAWEVPRPEPATLADAQHKAVVLAQLVSALWEELSRPCSARVVALALRYAERRRAATELERAVVVHGDPHPDNALQVLAERRGAESGFVFIDPDGFLADPTYDLGVVLRGWCDQLLAGDATATGRRCCRLLASLTGLDETAIWEWGFLERVSTGLYLLQFGAHDLSRPYLESAERIA